MILSCGSLGALYATIVSTYAFPALFVPLAASWFLSVVLLTLLARPYFHRLATRTNPMPDALRSEAEGVAAESGVSIRGAWLAADTPGSRPATIAGLVGWDRHLIVDEWLYATLTPDEREALVAREAALVRRRHLLYTHAIVGLIALVGGLLASVVWTVSPLPGVGDTTQVGALALGTGVALWIAFRHGTGMVFAADERAARHTSPAVVARLLEKQVQHGAGADERWPFWLIRMCPPTKRRIRRIRTRERRR